MSKRLASTDLRKHLREQISFLQSSAQLYDQGKEAEAKRIAATIRVLVNDTPSSNSLLGQLHLKKQMQFLNTAHKFSDTNLLTQQCLLMMRIDKTGGKFLPLFEESSRIKWQSFPDWNNEIVLSDTHHKVYRRKDIIKLLANKDGGAHVDPEITDDLAELKNPDFTGWIYNDTSGKERSMNNDATLASMRQMGFEILQSLYKVRPQLFELCYF